MKRKTAPEPVPAAAPWAFAIAAFTFLVFLPSLGNGFVNWDDGPYVYENQHIWKLGPELIGWAFTSLHPANWHPLTLLSLALDHAFWGLAPMGYHLTNVFLHAANAGLVFLFAAALIRPAGPGESGAADPVPAAVVAALLFAVHPMRVESVAWVSQRKDLLCGFFTLLSLLAYLRHARAPGGDRGAYAAALGTFALALMSKSMAVTLPVVLLILDAFPLRRLREGRRVLWEKVPFLLLSAGTALATLWAQRAGGAMVTLAARPMEERLLNAVRSPVFYLWKTLLPTGLAPFSPFPERASLWTWDYGLPALAFAAITWLCWRWRRRFPAMGAAWACYLVTLLPVLGLVQVGRQAAADRYAYLPGLAPLILLGAGASLLHARLGRAGRGRSGAALAAALFGAGALSWLSVRQTRVWKDSVSLWSHEVGHFPDRIAFAHSNLGLGLYEAGRKEEAMAQYDKAVRLDPADPNARFNRGIALAGLDRTAEAVEEYRRALEAGPAWSARVRNNLGNAYLKLGKADEARAQYEEAARLDPGYADAWFGLGGAFDALGRPRDAVERYREALKLKPDYVEARANLAVLYGKLGESGLAIAEGEAAAAASPQDATALYNLGAAYQAAGKTAPAIESYRRALALKPDYPECRNNLGAVYASLGRWDEAIREYRAVLDAEPDRVEVRANLGVAYAGKGLRKEAEREFKEVLRRRPGFAAAEAMLRRLRGQSEP